MNNVYKLADAQDFLLSNMGSFPAPLRAGIANDLKAIERCNKILEDPKSTPLAKEIALSDLGYYQNEVEHDLYLAKVIGGVSFG